jgi:hypothetical protein
MGENSDEQSSILLKLLNDPDCQKTMTLTHISPGEPGYHRLTFRCEDCHHDEVVAVKAHGSTALTG